MNLKDKLEDHFQKLIKEGENILNKCGYTRSEFIHFFPSGLEYNKWYSSAKNIIEKACGTQGIHDKQIEKIYTIKRGNSYFMPDCLEIGRAHV